MESLLKEVAAAAEGTASTQTSSSLHPGIQERVNLQGSASGAQATASGSSVDAPPMPPAPTPEQQQQMLEFLENLQNMQQTDPGEFDKAMSSLMGIPAGAGGEGVSAESKSNSLASMIGSIQSMRNGEGVQGDDASSKINIGQKQPEQPGIYITPEPGFVMKTRKIEANTSGGTGVEDDNDKEGGGKGMKVFMNICIHEQVGPPGLKKRLDANGEEVEGMNIPMSVGSGRYGEDKNGAKCLIYDIIVNKKVLDESREDKSGKYRDFVCQLGMQCLEQKFTIELDRRYKLPKLKYMFALDGEVDKQYIKDRTKSPQIEEVSETSETASKAAQNRLKQKALEDKAMQEAKRLAEVDLPHSFSWVVRSVADAGEGTDAVIDGPEVGLPSLKGLFSGKSNEYREPITRLSDSGGSDGDYALCLRAEIANAQGLQESDVVLKLNPFRMTLKLPRYKPLSVYFPVSVNPAEVSCALSRREGYTSLMDLRLVMTLDTTDWASTADPGSKAWLMEAALSSEEEAAADLPGARSQGTGNSGTMTSITGSNPYASRKEGGEHGGGKEGDNGADESVGVAKSSALEDVYHLRPSGNVAGAGVGKDDRGILHAEEEEIELPEDKFHRADASSSYYISQREQAVKDKWDKADKEREERKKNPDPNVEYIDMEDFEPGGKMDKDKNKNKSKGESEGEEGTDGAGSEYGVTAGTVQSGSESSALKKASDVVAEKAGLSLQGLSLSSSTWTELLD